MKFYAQLYREVKNYFFWLVARRTVGARALVIDKDKVLLVKHTYMEGWYSIGGGVERGESGLQAIKRELQEEAGIYPLTLDIFGFYYSRREKRDDYIIFYICKEFEQRQRPPSTEILEAEWFPMSNLPRDVSAATRRRVQEYLKEVPLSHVW